MSATSKHAGGGSGYDAETVLLWSVLILITVGVAATSAAVHLGAMLDGDRQTLPANPFRLVLALADGTLGWPTSATVLLVAIGVLLTMLALTLGVWVARRRRGASRVDRAARRMGQRRDIAPVSKKGATATAKRLGVQTPGLPLGRTIAGDQSLFASWEDVGLDIAGPRTGKTTGGSITAILNAPGAAVATSNKRDLVDATRDPRATHGEVWVFDPQQIVDEPADWW
ncbi:MAG: type IV secretory system conjugative DNA transfer family protein, partial [Actinobacteria bacterium]|nr:type IV secretory system conjugative DNA transfer family protein [Actinomycetota bacterium]